MKGKGQVQDADLSFVDACVSVHVRRLVCDMCACVCVLWGRETFWTGIVGSIMSAYSVSWDSTCKECSHLLVHQSSLRAGDCRACKSGVISTPSASSPPRILPDFKFVYSLSYFAFSKYAHAYLSYEFSLF